MKILSFEHNYVLTKTTYTVVSSVRNSEKIPFITLEIITDEGIKGVSYIQSFNPQVTQSIISILKLLEELLIGKNPLATEELWRDMWDKTLLYGHWGIVTFAISLIDIALWDIKGKVYNQPIYRLLGGTKNIFDVYASDGLWLVNEAVVLKQSEELLSLGFQSVKMRMGRKDSEKDIKVLKVLRDEWGKDLEIMVDVNQGWSRHKAEDMLKELSLYELYWVEEPIKSNDLAGYAKLTNNSETRICFGENIYGHDMVYKCLKLNTASFFTPDLQRIGGVTGWLRILPFLEYYKIPCTLHLFPEIAIHLLSAYQYAEKVEWMSWSSDLFKNPIQCNKGEIQIPELPGFGLELKKSK